MKSSRAKKIYSIVFLIALLFPIGVNFAHTFEKHDFQNCGDQLQFHTHNNENNCSVYHYSPNHQTLGNLILVSFSSHGFIYQINQQLSILFVRVLYVSKQLRAPPVLKYLSK